MSTKGLKYYSKSEEISNVLTHGIGFLLSIPALIFLINLALEKGGMSHLIGYIVFGASMLILYLASTVYHAVQKPNLRKKLNILDHAAIYVLIAGTYTPFTLVGLEGGWKWSIFGTVWGIALVGVIFKLFFTGKFNLLSTILYVSMGWLIVIAYQPLSEGISSDSLYWLFAGGIAYTIGAVLYMIRKMPFNHAIFHLFVLIGTGCHFLSVSHLVDQVV
ncbi:MAG: hemolysin III family protein [Flavobacteriales bacterium]|jgi:hemolysin III|nr:hemolysin III family protein [Flavobacteriales bacterium]